MKANELRIGNYVWDSYSGVMKVYALNNELAELQKTNDLPAGKYLLKFIKPIPLTEEWLRKSGFTKRESSICNQWWNGLNNVTHDWLVDITEMIDDGTFFYRNGKHVIKYVHQLQNLYFVLAGDELTFKQI